MSKGEEVEALLPFSVLTESQVLAYYYSRIFISRITRCVGLLSFVRHVAIAWVASVKLRSKTM